MSSSSSSSDNSLELITVGNNTDGVVMDNDNNLDYYPDLTQLSFIRILFLILYSLVMFLALFGNLVVCYTVVINPKMQTVVNCYIVNLALADFMVGAFVLPVKLLELMAPANWSAFSDSLCSAISYLQTVIVFSSVLTLVAICLERYFAIIHPLKSRINKSKSRTFKIIFMTYLIPSVAALPFLYPDYKATPFTFYSSYGTISRLSCLANFDPQFRKIYYTFLFITFYLIPLLIIGWTCFCIARSLLRITGLNRQGSLRRQEVNRRKIGQMILIVVLAYTISWTPYFIVSIITQYQKVNFMHKHNFYFTMLSINLFAFLNSGINPFIYAIMSTRFRNGFMKILRLI
ncbi:cholecystokinin receptor type A-like, partial [Oppia nitens]|uniref:cholecystokinin receptor type A-like n=1 Tax=Oppia nitens TaxID=1686743 RepID=UPI0023DBEBBB